MQAFPRSSTVVLVDSRDERTFLHVPGANGALSRDELDDGLLYAGRALHIAGALVMERLDGEPVAGIAAGAQRRGIVTSLDTVWDPTVGARGCYASGKRFSGVVEGVRVSAVDDTGAGDAFAAGMLYGKLAGWPLEQSARFACAAGALATTAVGAGDGLGELEEVLALAGLE